MDFLAHISDDGRTQTVQEHLENVATRCAAFAEAFNAGEQGYLIGKAHDIGKYSDAFQDRLRGGPIVDHATAGALECAKKDALWAACCVAGHHGGLPDVGNMNNDVPGDPTLIGRLKNALHNGIPPYVCPEELPLAHQPDGYGKELLTDSFLIRMLYSCLVDADYLDTECFMSSGAIQRDSGDSLQILLDKLNQYIDPWWKPGSELNKRRCEILKSCIDGGSGDKGLYTLTVPTGGGKTIASMAFALNHAVQHKMDRIIYIIPYTSIIEQTASVFRNIFGDRNVIEHHANANSLSDDADIGQYSQIRATENWDAPIIVTTAVQFFESMYANRPSKCRKLHSIANSVLIFDEAQMLPREHLDPCVAAIAEMVSHFHSTAVLCTATQPALNDLFKRYAPGFPIRELCPDTVRLFEQFRRVSFRQIGTINAEELGDHLARLPQVLCIVNSRKSAQLIYRMLPENGSYHLSTLMVPAHRQHIFFEIRSRLKADLPCRVVSTSLIEAGVDVDFPTVYRELSGLDSILQAAGRCNRENKRIVEDSIVTIFDGVSTIPQILKTNIGATKEVLRPGVDPSLPETITKYFRSFRSLVGTLDQYAVVKAFSEGIQGRMLPFRTIAEKFHLINDDTRTIYIPFGEGEKLINRLRRGDRSRVLLRKLGRYGVNIYEKHYQALMNQGALEVLDEESIVLNDLSLYHQNIGLQLDSETGTGLFI